MHPTQLRSLKERLTDPQMARRRAKRNRRSREAGQRLTRYAVYRERTYQHIDAAKAEVTARRMETIKTQFKRNWLGGALGAVFGFGKKRS